MGAGVGRVAVPEARARAPSFRLNSNVYTNRVPEKHKSLSRATRYPSRPYGANDNVMHRVWGGFGSAVIGSQP